MSFISLFKTMMLPATLVAAGVFAGCSESKKNPDLPVNNEQIKILTRQAQLVNGPEFELEVPNKDGGHSQIGFDCDLIEIKKDDQGQLRGVVTLGLVSQFNPLGDMTGMESMSQQQKDLILMGARSRSTDTNQVAFMLKHIELVHRINPDGAKNVMRACKEDYFPQLAK